MKYKNIFDSFHKVRKRDYAVCLRKKRHSIHGVRPTNDDQNYFMMLKQDEEEINMETERRQYKKSSFRRALLK